MTVYEQLTEYCDCLVNESVDAADGIEPRFTYRMVDELINLISTYTCWTTKVCETFLQSERREVVDVPDCIGNCDVFEFDPYFAPFDPDSFTFTLIEQNGIEETLTDVTSYRYSEADEKFRLELPLPDCTCSPQCGCKSNYKLMVNYVAGYEEIPECLLPLMCEALQWIIEKNKCDCEACQDCENKYANTNEIDYTTLTGRIQEHFLTILTAQYFRQLSMISLCRRRNDMWAVVA